MSSTLKSLMVASQQNSTTGSSPIKIWDLSNVDAFPQWNQSIRREIRSNTHELFLQSKRPSEETEEVGGDRKRKLDEKIDPGLLARQTLWDDWNKKAYDIIEGAITISTAQINYITVTFGESASKPFDGQKFYAWVISHANSTKTSYQLKLKKEITALKIEPSASASDINKVLEDIENKWPLIISYDQSSPRPMVEHALGLFPHQHPYIHRVSSLQAILDTQAKMPWKSFHDFRLALQESLLVAEERAGSTQAAFPFVQRQQRQGNWRDNNRNNANDTRVNLTDVNNRSKCKHCDWWLCPAKANEGISKCCICSSNNITLPSNCSAGMNRLALMLRAYYREHKPSTMKGVTLDANFRKAYKEKNPPSSSSSTQNSASNGTSKASVRFNCTLFWAVRRYKFMFLIFRPNGNKSQANNGKHHFT